MTSYHLMLMKTHNPQPIAGFGQMDAAQRLAMASAPRPVFNRFTGERVK